MYIANAIRHMSQGIKLINLLPDGDFENNLNDWIIDSNTGTLQISSAEKYAGSSSLQISMNNQRGALQKDVAGNIGDIMYCCAFAKRTSGNTVYTVLRLFDYGTTSTVNAVPIISSAQINNNSNWDFYSVVRTNTNEGVRVSVNTGGADSTIEFYLDNMFIFNLTRCFGAGKEPTKEQMDAFMQAQTTYFIERDYMKVG